MKALIGAVVVALGTIALSADATKYGTGVSLTETTSIKALVETPAAYVGKTIRVDGVATAVCKEMGCWMAIAATDDPKGPTVRLKVEHGVIKFPVTAKGKQVSAEGVFEEVPPGDEHEGMNHAAAHAKDTHSKEAHAAPAQAHDAHAKPAAKKYQLKATGAVVN